ncbi:SIR2 family protein [Ancylomarina sp. 16SWW S1-10-2]|uniref:SIR2 family protein n=1 Tax=Ancylomarina sp. 16SWW S1-10-2 TaxID=2499681 RepID=UPI0012AE4FE9|nr:SIR2 family protein [Ancylomarina sp. 16SWW S1-10-2]MRT92395.1 hypothetical protein [Ancylomarina sp. 16SWW S1-10-2]
MPKNIRVNKGDNKKVTILLGAGATFPWEGPSSEDIRKRIIDTKAFVIKSGNRTVGEYIFSQLETYYGMSQEVNFETFLAVLESIVDYLFSASAKGATSPLFVSSFPAIFNLNDFVEEVKDTNIINEKLLEASGFPDSGIESTMSYEELNTSQRHYIDLQYFTNMYNYYMEIVSKCIADYTYNLDKKKFQVQSDHFRTYISSWIEKGYTLRIYTTNYDRLIPELLKDKYDVFNGFTTGHTDVYEQAYAYNTKVIHEDRMLLNYYNLHGCLNWRSSRALDNLYNFECTPNQVHHGVEFVGMERTNPGQEVVKTNIVTGYNKLQHTSIEPLNLFFNSFANDCYSSELIVSVGFSYSDFYIGRIIANALNKFGAKLLHVTYAKNASEVDDRREWHNINQTLFDSKAYIKRIDDKDDSVQIKCEGNDHLIFIKGFEEFLNQ